jgi:hypothetical protein
MDYSLQYLEQCHKGTFSWLANSPWTWLSSAESLKKAADVLRNTLWSKEEKPHDTEAAVTDREMGPVYLMLVAMAVESLIKGILIAKDHDRYVKKDCLSKEICKNGHDLCKLYELTGKRKWAVEAWAPLLVKLSEFTINYGRYPVAKSREKMKGRVNAGYGARSYFIQVDLLWKHLMKEMGKYYKRL